MSEQVEQFVREERFVPVAESGDRWEGEAEFGAVVEQVMADEGWVCVPHDHEDIPQPGECIDCDASRHRFGYRLFAALRPSVERNQS